MNFTELRKAVIKKDFGKMNERQFDAVVTTKGPLLILAGAGSGKTTVLVNRIAYLVKYGDAWNSSFIPEYSNEDIKLGMDYIEGKTDYLPRGIFSVYPANPWDILAITFTNKAAGELKERIALKLGDAANDIWAGTFHSVCGKILRRYAELIGYTSHFTIYDTDDQRRLVKEIMKDNNIDDKLVPHRTVLAEISAAKDMLISPAEYRANCGNDYRKQTIAEIYRMYQNRLKNADAMDFDDMIVKTVELLKNNSDVLEYYTKKFKYVMVDEYQDTNHAQYVLVSLLASGYNNLCVVGDDDQSIYRFRGATIENILNFEDEYSNSKVIRLEQNYRSTSTILNAANAVIKNNMGRKGKNLWTDNGNGEKIKVYTAPDEREEGRFVADSILENVRNGSTFSKHAVLYRMNAQSNAIENTFARSGISYKVIGGMKFFDRKEIKDIIAYLNVINNTNDDIRLRRIINEPKRGIGETTVNHAAQIARELGTSLFEVMSRADEFAALSRSAQKLKQFCGMITELNEQVDELSIHELFLLMLEKSEYKAYLVSQGSEAADRLENVEEFSSTILQYQNENEAPSLSGFLEEISLFSDLDSMDDNDDKVVLMTIHSAKGLEFENVYLIGMEEGIFPGNQSIYGGPEEIEEERRLAYVAITRAKKNLYISNAYTRMIFGSTNRNMPSRFLKEIPDNLCDISSKQYNPYAQTTVAGYSSSGIGYNRYANATKTVNNSFASSFSAAPKNNSAKNYVPGTRVSHRTFGEGTVLSSTPMGIDCMLEISFDNAGNKKLMAEFAKLKIL